MQLSSINSELGLLYHGTDVRNAPEILANGLDPALSTCADDEEANDDEGFGSPYHFVYLTPSQRVAANFAPGGDDHRDKDTNKRAIFAVRLPPELQAKLIVNRGEFIRVPFAISPSYITRIV